MLEGFTLVLIVYGTVPLDLGTTVNVSELSTFHHALITFKIVPLSRLRAVQLINKRMAQMFRIPHVRRPSKHSCLAQVYTYDPHAI